MYVYIFIYKCLVAFIDVYSIKHSCISPIQMSIAQKIYQMKIITFI